MKNLVEEAIALNKCYADIDPTSAIQVNSFLQHFTSTVLRWEKDCSRAEIIEALAGIRSMAAASPFIERAQLWPRGYAGDFETIGYILDAKNKAIPSSFAYHLEDFFLQSPICEQHRNKVTKQAELVRETLAKKPTAKILSIGSGTSEDLYRCLPEIKSSACCITLVDIDDKALHYSVSKLQSITSRLSVIHGNIYKVIRRLNSHYDLILIGGVFDYLNDHVIAVILKELINKMNNGGALFFTNIAKGNPYRICMEYLSNWILIERDENDIASLLDKAGVQLAYTVQKDATGLTHMVTVCVNHQQ